MYVCLFFSVVSSCSDCGRFDEDTYDPGVETQIEKHSRVLQKFSYFGASDSSECSQQIENVFQTAESQSQFSCLLVNLGKLGSCGMTE